MHETLAIQIIYFGCGLCLLQALERIIVTKKILSVPFFFHFFNFIMILDMAFIARGIQFVQPLAIFLFYSTLLVIGPLNLFYYHSLLYPARPLPYRKWLHLVPSMACVAAEIIFHLRPLPFRLEINRLIFSGPLNPVRGIVLFLLAGHTMAYFLYIVKIYQFDLGFRRTQKEFRFISLIAVLVLVVVAMIVASSITGITGLFLGGSVLTVISQICLFMGMWTNPQFFTSLKMEIRKKRYERSMLVGIDTDVVRRRITELMKEERIYRDSEITLSTLAKRLSLSAHQLSEFLNEQMGMGYRDYLSRYRIEEARQILMQNRRANIMAVCFRVGFNSKSSFNTAFKKITGLTPKEFRNQHCKFSA